MKNYATLTVSPQMSGKMDEGVLMEVLLARNNLHELLVAGIWDSVIYSWAVVITNKNHFLYLKVVDLLLHTVLSAQYRVYSV